VDTFNIRARRNWDAPTTPGPWNRGLREPGLFRNVHQAPRETEVLHESGLPANGVAAPFEQERKKAASSARSVSFVILAGEVDANDTEEIPLYARERSEDGTEVIKCLGWFPPEIIRPMFTRKEATFVKMGQQRAAVLKADAPALLRARALSSSGATQALSTTYTEDLYPDSPEQLRHKKENGIPLTVTATVCTLKKYRGPKVGFVPWTANDRFKRKRFDPDRIKPQFPTVRIAERSVRHPAGSNQSSV
jgi:hypothetical protein